MDKVQKFRKKKVAMLLLYNGAGYQGLQKNPNAKTIESDLLDAMVDAGVIPKEGAEDPGTKISFQRAARTDKGVSAAGQVVSMKIFIDVDSPVEKINKHLPDQIRVIGIKRVTQGFNSKNHCVARTYLYVIPTLAFCPVEKVVREDFRITDDIIAKVRSVLEQYKGTHNFHNFTSGKKPEEASAKRYIMEFSMGEPYVRDGLEFAVMTVKGQSFMIHQIRKMIGIAIAIVRGLASEDAISRAWGHDKFDVPIAPSLGLLLDKLHYDAYNRKYGNDGMHVPVSWDEYSDVIEKFKEEDIFSVIYRTEKKKRKMLAWMSTLHLHTFDEAKMTAAGVQRETSEMHKAFMNVREVRKEKANSVRL
ncbi:hypothetical protein NP493_1913g00027 [Ridgeia piscesae]|uniref:Pseudouridylate synthase 1 homolog n=1 Tax=Ridgeia piscesae TaxID=27915 RepID=A0AAD9N4Y9_RIDPI|nr:hypothetical protein NP493_1913g00027 [Ridgeia piscesae]